jgi:mannose/fructose/N-acetylgalactosamine-specific phosphotransferase system component IID
VWLERPLYRGAIIVSIWIVVAMLVSFAVQLPFVFVRLQGATNFEQVQTILQTLASAHAPEPLMLAAYATSALVHAAIRPLLGIAFVVLYFDAKAGHQENEI